MLSQIIQRLFHGVGLACIFGVTIGLISTQAAPKLEQPPTEDCTACHKLIGEHWVNSAHGQASDNAAFNEAWDEQGNPPMCMACHATDYDASSQTWETPGVDCQTCHTPYNENHPDEIMPTDVSSRLCGNCHLETFSQWQDSIHGKENLTCNQCHNAHSTSLKAENSQELCQACHREQVHSFELTIHATNGLLCIDCHLKVSKIDLGEGHGQRVHTFTVDLETCTECHGEGLHAPSVENLTDSPETEDILPNPYPTQVNLQTEPEKVSPVGFTILGTLLGVGFGMIMAPWLEQWYRQFRN